MRTLLLLLSFVALAFCVPPVPGTQTINGVAGNGLIFYSDAFFALPNVVNPVSVDIVFNNGTGSLNANICLNPFQSLFPTPGNNFNACPDGGLATGVVNTTAATGGSSKLKFNRQSSSLKLGQILSKMVEDTNPNAQSAFASSTNGASTAGLTVTINDATTPIDFTVTVSYNYCEDDSTFPNADGSDCVAATALTFNDTTPATIPANSTSYFYFTTDAFDSTVDNQLVINYNISGGVYVQKGYIPTSTWSIPQAEAGVITINTPGYFASGETYYISAQNTADSDLAVSFTVNYTSCGAGLVGPGCAVNQTNTNTTDGSTVISLSASLSTEEGGSANDGNAWEIDLSDSDNQFAYFLLIDLPQYTTPYYVRVSVGNTDLEDDEDNFGPTLYAKKNGFPSAESHDVVVTGSVANQAILQVDDYETDEWYIAVQLPSDFSIWVGVNCPGNCSNNDHGSCQCSLADGTTENCQDLVNATNLTPLYSLPVATGESAGSCSCSDNDYDLSFDCSQKSSPTVLFIVLIVIGGLIILFVAIGVPLYCYISNKRKERYERI